MSSTATNHPSLLPPNASRLERAVEQATARLGEINPPIRPLWNATTCPLELLPWLAWALSIDTWESHWSEKVKRERVRKAIAIQRKKGTLASIRAVVKSFGGDIVLREWWQYDPPQTPHTFNMTLTISSESGEQATARYVDDVIAEVWRTKPVRSHFTFSQGLHSPSKVGLVAAARAAAYRRLSLRPEFPNE